MHIMNIPNFFNFWPFLCYSTLYSKEAQLISSLNLVYKQILQLMCESFSFEFKENQLKKPFHFGTFQTSLGAPEYFCSKACAGQG